MKPEGKRVVITGGASGIGKALLDEFLRLDARVVVGDLGAGADISGGEKVRCVRCDVSDPREVDRLFDEAVRWMGGIDIFVANAGFAYYEKFEQAGWDHIRTIMDVDFVSPLYSLDRMNGLNGGREFSFVITASAMAMLPIPGYALYSAAKAAIDAFAKAYRHEQNGHGRLIIAYPIATKTGFFDSAGKGIPVPWPRQRPETVARAIIRGIRRNRKAIHPSRLFRAILILDRVFPFILPAYALVERRKFHAWQKRAAASAQDRDTSA